MSQNKLQVACRYGGNFVEGPDHKVSYKDDTNRLICVHPEIEYPALQSKLLQVCKFTEIESIKYQYPTLGLDSLFSVENDEDVLNMKEAFSSQRNCPIQLFVFPRYCRMPPKPRIDKGKQIMKEKESHPRRERPRKGIVISEPGNDDIRRPEPEAIRRLGTERGQRDGQAATSRNEGSPTLLSAPSDPFQYGFASTQELRLLTEMMSQKKLPVVCRYGGNFVEGTDHKVSYKDGTNRLIYVNPEIDYTTLLSKLLQVCKFIDTESIKYQYPTLGLDSPVSLENDEDVLFMKEAFSSERNGPIQLFIAGSQKTLPIHDAIPRNEGSPALLSVPSDPFQFAMAQVIVSPLLDAIFENLGFAAMQELRLVWGAKVEKELQNLKSTLSAIQAVLEDAEERQFEFKAVQDWLHKLKDVAYDADDLVDEIVTEAQQSKAAETGTEAGKKRKQHYISSSLRCSRQDMACRINEMNVLLAEIETERRGLHLETRDGSRRLQIIREGKRLVSSVRGESSQVFGREGDREHIIKSLLSDDSGTRNFSVVAIVGVGGVGKTTLAKVVFNDKRVRENFELREWVYASGHFDNKSLTEKFLASASKSSCDFFCIDRLQYGLRYKLFEKKFLMVLDNVGNEMGSDKWEQFQVPFTFGAKGSKILVTTRSQAVVDVMRATCPYNLLCLSKKDCWSLLVSEAFHDDNLNPDLLKIGAELMDKCKGIPLATKALVGLLSSKREVREWENILKSPMWDFQGPASEILPALRLSYQHLPAHLKPCFIFCSIFPKDYKFEKERLVQLWVAHGFICPEEGKHIEDTGCEYFSELLSRSFFQPHDEEEEWSKYTIFDLFSDSFYWYCLDPSVDMLSSKRTSYKMNGPFHDLAKFILDNESHGILRKIRHLSYDEKPINFESFYELKGLRTFFPLKIINEEVVDEIFQRSRFVRVLDLSLANIMELPDSIGNLPNSIGNLRHLRYLNLSWTDIEGLPESICSIYNMQTLLLTGCGNLGGLPNEMRKLTNLRHLDLAYCMNIESMPPQIGRLNCLQTLPLFIVGREKERGIAELKELTDIRGRLVIEQLENVTDAEHARQANLRNKPLIDELTLVWSEGLTLVWSEDSDDGLQNERFVRNEGVQEEVADGLKPHPNLKALGFWGYMGAHFPSWMMEMDLFLPNLQTLYLRDCGRCSILPPLGRLPSLSSLVIHRMDEVKKIESVSGGLPPLKDLFLGDMRNLEQWHETEGAFPYLGRLCIVDCPQLRQLPYSPLANITYLHIRCCERLISLPRMPCLKELRLHDLGNLEEWCGVGDAHFPHLQKLSISYCPRMRRWPTILPLLTHLKVRDCLGFDALPLLPYLCQLDLEGLCGDRLLTSVSYLTSLQSLDISNIPYITMLRGMLQALTQLKYLKISRCFGLVKLQDVGLPSALAHLSLYQCNNLESLSGGLHALTSLHTLIIDRCPLLTSLPEEGLPAALQTLSIWGCPTLKERCKKGRGEDWPKISRVPRVVMDRS